MSEELVNIYVYEYVRLSLLYTIVRLSNCIVTFLKLNSFNHISGENVLIKWTNSKHMFYSLLDSLIKLWQLVKLINLVVIFKNL